MELIVVIVNTFTVKQVRAVILVYHSVQTTVAQGTLLVHILLDLQLLVFLIRGTVHLLPVCPSIHPSLYLFPFNGFSVRRKREKSMVGKY